MQMQIFNVLEFLVEIRTLSNANENNGVSLFKISSFYGLKYRLYTNDKKNTNDDRWLIKTYYCVFVLFTFQHLSETFWVRKAMETCRQFHQRFFACFFRTNVLFGSFSNYVLALAPKFRTKNARVNVDEIDTCMYLVIKTEWTILLRQHFDANSFEDD